MSKSNAPALRIIARLLVAAALLGFLFTRQADLHRVGQLLKGLNLRWLPLALFIAVSGEIMTAYKWRRLISHIHGNLPILKAIHASFVGMFYNNFFPGSVGGDIARVLLVAKEAGGKARATASTFMQRNTGLAALFLVGIPASLIYPLHFDWPGLPPTLPKVLTHCTLWLTLAAAGYAAINAIFFSHAIYQRIWRLSDLEETRHTRGRWHHALRVVLRKIQRFHTELRGYKFWLAYPLAISIVTQLTDIYMVWCLGQGLGIPVPFTVLLVALPVINIGNLLPLTINGIGLRETLYVALLHSSGISANQAIALSLLHFSIIITLAAAGGLIHLATPVQKSPIP